MAKTVSFVIFFFKNSVFWWEINMTIICLSCEITVQIMCTFMNLNELVKSHVQNIIAKTCRVVPSLKIEKY